MGWTIFWLRASQNEILLCKACISYNSLRSSHIWFFKFTWNLFYLLSLMSEYIDFSVCTEDCLEHKCTCCSCEIKCIWETFWFFTSRLLLFFWRNVCRKSINGSAQPKTSAKMLRIPTPQHPKTDRIPQGL